MKDSDLIRRSDAENIFRNARRAMKPENYSGQEFFIRDNILLNAEQIVHALPAVDAVEYELADDGTLTITIPNGTKVGRVLVNETGTHFGGLYYPDVDAVEVRHGRWIGDNRFVGWPNWNCSICYGEGRGDYKFCPWCGARMDGRREDGDA